MLLDPFRSDTTYFAIFFAHTKQTHAHKELIVSSCVFSTHAAETAAGRTAGTAVLLHKHPQSFTRITSRVPRERPVASIARRVTDT